MWLVAGLGNPGPEYADTRHNLGWMLTSALREAWGASRPRIRCGTLCTEARFGDHVVTLAQPLSFMNLCGPAVAHLMEELKISPAGLLVLCDDISLPLGQLRIRPQGSDGGHKGLRSIINELGSEEFARLRMGIGSPTDNQDIVEWILKSFVDVEWDEVAFMLRQGIAVVEVYLDRGIEASQELANARRYQSQEERR